ncbi:hypothetical protein CBS76997_10089 [Aspergillus niger]|nr:hypothetical protein CBS12448_5587 [Aspergillus niger]KAI2873405.1 hypothetical protein CBS13152_9865 [Aspergillus niger]KAI2910470.1 hypothetical protein CBS147371_8879 [Aspergillus niger]KAI2935615.1 hypothetical protein CBS147321_8896 [Aspergillus niger]KAI2939549.1 hypothetical protein CBS147322_10138 [Aspergillus niger]
MRSFLSPAALDFIRHLGHQTCPTRTFQQHTVRHYLIHDPSDHQHRCRFFTLYSKEFTRKDLERLVTRPFFIKIRNLFQA